MLSELIGVKRSRIAGPLGAVEHRDPRVGRRSVFGTLALVLLIVELMSAVPESAQPLQLTLWALASSLALALAGWLPDVGGTAFAVITAIAVSVPSLDAQLSILVIGAYVVTADWVSRRWYLPAAVQLTVVEAAQMHASGNWQADAIGLALGGSAAILTGLGIQRLDRHVIELRSRTEEAERASLEAGARARREMVVALHDSIATDLVRIITTANGAAKQSTAPAANADMLSIETAAREAMTNLRHLMSEGAGTDRAREQSLDEVVESCRAMLAGRRITLDAEIPDTFLAACTQGQLVLLSVVVREGATNAVKYARTDSSVHLSLEVLDSGEARAIMTNAVDNRVSPGPGPLSGGLGLVNLSERLERAGGRLRFGTATDMWVLAAEIPSDQAQAAIPGTLRLPPSGPPLTVENS